MFSKRRPLAPAKSFTFRLFFGTALAVSVAGCSSFGANGPSSGAILDSANKPLAGATINVMPLTDDVARQLITGERPANFPSFSGNQVSGALIGNGDVLEITLWEAPRRSVRRCAHRTVVISRCRFAKPVPAGQVVDANGQISVPFAGSIQAAGRTPAEIERDIVARLRGKAHQPQAVGSRGSQPGYQCHCRGRCSERRPRSRLPPRASGLFDVLASAGGAKNPVSKTMIQLSRGDRVASMPLEAVIRDPHQNVVIQPDDVVTVYLPAVQLHGHGRDRKQY